MGLFLFVSRLLGRFVCRCKGHDFYTYEGSYNSYSAYRCIRCDSLNRSLESLEPAPHDAWEDRFYEPTFAELKADWKLQARWIHWSPWPYWPTPWKPD